MATAVGILVALPAVAAFNYFQRRIASLLSGTEVLSNLVLAYLSDRTSGPAGGGGFLNPPQSREHEGGPAIGVPAPGRSIG